MGLRVDWKRAGQAAMLPFYPIYWLFTDEWEDFSLKRIASLACLGGAVWAGNGIYNHIKDSQAQEAAQDQRVNQATAPEPQQLVPANRTVSLSSVSYRLTGVNTAQAQDGDVTYSFNFRSEIAHIDGPDAADGIIRFSDLPNKAYHDNAKRVACTIGRSHIDHKQPANSVPVLFYRAHCQ